MEWVIGIIVILALVGLVVDKITKGLQGAQGRDRCAFCKRRLKFMGSTKASQQGGKAGYATVCSGCGREQPWAAAGSVAEGICPLCGKPSSGGKPHAYHTPGR